MYEIIEGKEEHLPIVFELEKKIFEPNLQASEEIIRERFKRYNGLVLVKQGETYVGYNSFAPIKEEFVFNFKEEFKEGILPPSVISNDSPYFDSISMAVLEGHRRSDLLKQGYSGKIPSQLMREYMAKRALKEGRKFLTSISESIYSYGMNTRFGYKIIGTVRLENNITANLMFADLNDELLRKIENYY